MVSFIHWFVRVLAFSLIVLTIASAYLDAETIMDDIVYTLFLNTGIMMAIGNEVIKLLYDISGKMNGQSN